MVESPPTVDHAVLTEVDVLEDYRIVVRSRQASLIGRREVMTGKAKFGIFGDGKELPQIAMAKVLRPGDFRSGYYRDQTLMFASGVLTVQQFFAQLYAHADIEADPACAGRTMNSSFATRSINPDGSWKNLTEQINAVADVAPTASQMPPLVGLAYASRLYRELEELQNFPQFSHNGDEIAFGTIGNASTAEGMFWESINAIGVLKAPALISIYDDGYGISVTNEYQMLKENIGDLLSGFQRAAGSQNGFEVLTVHGWDYTELINTYQKSADLVRQEHVPVIIHVIELTQPQGHSTSGSHERYKPWARLVWEKEYDCMIKFRQWILATEQATPAELDQIEEEEQNGVEEERRMAWEAFSQPVIQEREAAAHLISQVANGSAHALELEKLSENLLEMPYPLRRDIAGSILNALTITRDEQNPTRADLIAMKLSLEEASEDRYATFLYSPLADSALKPPVVPPTYSPSSPTVQGFEVLNACFNAAFSREPRLVAFGEDVGKLGDVNQAFRGLQEKFGELRITDTGIRETTIVGQAIGLALRGLRPIAEIQYLDYLLYALQIMADDIANLLWRTKGGQKAPVILRTRGHRLEGVWHSGSPMAGIINLVRGMHVCVPRNMTQAAGFYNTLLLAEEPALVIEVLNGYRLKERLPDNIGDFTTPLGIPDIIRPGNDFTLVTYGACCRIALEACERLSQVGIDVEVIDVQTLLPFDIHGKILESLKKTSHILFVDEDVPGGTSAYMLQQVIEKQSGYYWLDSPPRTLPGKEHRPAYGTDGDYWSKPSADQIFETVYAMMSEVEPSRYPDLYQS
jgi:pyruvate/2-oxoglutarate/acetoin dehydrogenase E1 component/TPP-dependent pyruvate/acetoin dehydrogenase alpha subunit